MRMEGVAKEDVVVIETHTMHQQIVTVRTENLDPMMRHGSHTKLQCGEKFSAPSQQGALSRRF